MEDVSNVAALWWAVIGLGLYHGLNPGMGWPLAVSGALMEQRASALPRALVALAVGHMLSMLLILLPFSLMTALVAWEHVLRWIAAGLLIGLGGYLLITRRHPRFLARVSPAKLGLWSFLAAIAHGAGLMLVPLFLGICEADADAGHQAAFELMTGTAGIAFLVAFVHTGAMALAGGALAWGTYKWLGLEALRRTWFNLETLWALSLIAVGVASLIWAM